MKKLLAAGLAFLLLGTSLQSFEHAPNYNKKPKLKLIKKKPGQRYQKRIVIRNGKRWVLVKVKKRKIQREKSYYQTTSKEINVLYVPVKTENRQQEDNTSVQPQDSNLTQPENNTTLPASSQELPLTGQEEA